MNTEPSGIEADFLTGSGRDPKAVMRLAAFTAVQGLSTPTITIFSQTKLRLSKTLSVLP
jgi:hypothetical protein